MSTRKLDPSAYAHDPEAQRVAGVLAEEIEHLRLKYRSTESPTELGLLGGIGYPSDLLRWHELAAQIDVLTSTARRLEISLDSLVESIQKLNPANWEVFFWMGQWLQVRKKKSEREHALHLANELQKMSHADAQRARNSAAGARGGEERGRRYGPLKEWALKKATTMLGSDKSIARKLAAHMPNEFSGVSADPERLIYDALRARVRSR